MISIQNMSFGYNKALLFDRLNLKMEKGRVYGLLGLNGAGKTSLMKILSGLLFAKEGDVQVFGGNPRRRNPSLLSRIFFLPEEMYFPSISQKEYIVSRSSFYPAFDHEKFDHYVSNFEIPNKKLHKMSFGQKKKFALSFGLACGSELLVLDEPSNGLDIPSKGIFRHCVAEAVNDERIFIISTHQVRDVDSLIDPITILHEGKIIFEHSMVEISDNLHMSRSVTPPSDDSENLLYSEAGVGGYWSVWKGPDEHGGPVDLEILFNTVISRPDIDDTVFASQLGVSYE